MPAASFDTVVAIESLHFPKDLTSTIGQLKALLRRGGQMGLFYTHLGDTRAAVAPEETKLGQALRANDLGFEAHDLTESDRDFWQRSKDAAEVLARRFCS